MMGDDSTNKPAVTRLTRWTVTSKMSGRGKNRQYETGRWTIYGVGADGEERVYAELENGKEFEEWRATDPPWREAQAAMFDRLLSDPEMRDVVLKINIKAALDDGDTATAVKLARHLSPEAWRGLTEKDKMAESKTEKIVDYYMGLPYLAQVRHDEGGWFAKLPELPGCMTWADTFEELGPMIEDAKRGWIENALEQGDPVPEPKSPDDYSGRLNLRMPKGLHRDLARKTEEEGVSLNHLVVTTLARSVGSAE